MRNAALAALFVYVLLDEVLQPIWGVPGMWTAFLLYYVARATALGMAYPRITAGFAPG
jgi:MATE family multidrug resistance protein